jgi:predicted DNA-binding transcriptional regulator AlpA
MERNQETSADLAPLLRTDEAAQLLQLSPQRLAVMRLEGTGPSYVKISRTVRYSRAAIEAWLARNTRHSTSDPGSIAHLAA